MQAIPLVEYLCALRAALDCHDANVVEKLLLNYRCSDHYAYPVAIKINCPHGSTK